MTYTDKYLSPIGGMTMASDGEHLIGLWFEGQKHYMSTVMGDTTENGEIGVFRGTREWLDRYFKGEKNQTIPKIKLIGSDFQIDVWQVLMTIGYGDTLSYGDVAWELSEKLSRRTSARAVGGAVGRNPISLIVPCHRVIGKDGNIVGYAGGTDKKSFLLELEKSNK